MDYSKETPVFIITTREGRSLVVEAVVSNNSDNDIQEYD